MGTLEFEGKKYTFEWIRIALLFVGAPLFALGMYFSHDWYWLHEITSKFTIILLNMFSGGGYTSLNVPGDLYPWQIVIYTAENTYRGTIRFETLCTGVHAIAIFMGVILFTPHPFEKETNKDIWGRKVWAIIATSVIFYFVNVLRMIIQLSLYRNGASWKDVHYPISAASSFIAVACVLIMHKFVPEFIMSLIWIGDELRELVVKRKAIAENVALTDSDDEEQIEEIHETEERQESETVHDPILEDEPPLQVKKD